MESVIHADWEPFVSRAVAYVTREFPDIEKEDLSQYLWMKILENKKYISSHEERGVPTMLARWGATYAWDQRKEHLQLSPQYSYRTSDIKKILEVAFNRSDWDMAPVPDDAQSEYRQPLEVVLDVLTAYEKLGYAHQKAIFERYALGLSPEGPAAIKRLYRATCALTDSINWYQKLPGVDYVGTRKAITNANARVNLSCQEK